MKYAYLFIAILLLAACNSNGISTGADGHRIFTYEPLGWQMQLPDDWQVLSESQRDKLAYKAQNYYEEDASSRNKEGEKKIILGVRKGEKDMNAIYAFVREYRKGDDAPDMADLLNQQYRQYSTDMYTAEKSLTHEDIDGKPFDIGVLEVSYNGKPYFTYTTYSTMLGNTNFGVSIVTNNKTDEQMLISLFVHSVRSIR